MQGALPLRFRGHVVSLRDLRTIKVDRVLQAMPPTLALTLKELFLLRPLGPKTLLYKAFWAILMLRVNPCCFVFSASYHVAGARPGQNLTGLMRGPRGGEPVGCTCAEPHSPSS